MFSGIVETVGTITAISLIDGCKQLTITPQLIFSDLRVGDSVSTNGVCLTVTKFSEQSFDVTVVPETLRLTNLAHLQVGDAVNLERSLKLNDRNGGHYVQGHVDGMGEILELTSDNSAATIVKISCAPDLQAYIVKKGYITLDGMSITVIDVTPSWFSVTFIPHTQAATITKNYQTGHWINIEVDMMAKYVEKLLGAFQHAQRD